MRVALEQDLLPRGPNRNSLHLRANESLDALNVGAGFGWKLKRTTKSASIPSAVPGGLTATELNTRIAVIWWIYARGIYELLLRLRCPRSMSICIGAEPPPI